LARALATEPTVLLLDEPLGALDKSLRERMQFELRELQRKFGITTILVTHDQEEALTMSDRIAVMSDGVVVQVGRPTEVYERPRNRFVSEFLGTANIFTGRVQDAVGDGAWSVALALQPGVNGPVHHDGLSIGQPVTLAVRPERIEIGPVTPGRLSATVLDVVFRGTYFAYELRAEGQEAPLFAYSQHRQSIPEDGVVGLGWAPESPTVLEEPA
jgi:ABC-type Fe3+/spermidine/putrescine transport system ATPase subunit